MTSSPQFWNTAGLVAAALAATVAFVPRRPELRAAGMVAVLVLAPVLLVAELWNTHQISTLRSHPALAVALLIAGCAVIALLQAAFRRWPPAFAVLCVATIALRIPIDVGGRSANLLVPLYLVIAAGALGYAYERLVSHSWRLFPVDRRAGGLEVALVVAVGIYAAQAFYSSNFSQAFENVVFFYLPFLLLLRLVSSLAWSRRLVVLCLGSAIAVGLVFAAVGFWEYETQRLILNPRLVESNQFEAYFRVNSLFYDPNIYGRFLAIVMLLVCPVLLWQRSRRMVTGASLAVAIFWLALVLTFSRSSFWALLAGLIVLAVIRFGWIKTGAPLAAVALVGVFALATHPGALDLGTDPAKAINQATSGRYQLIDTGARMFGDRPLFGYGSGSFASEYRARNGPGSEVAASASHTAPITVASEQGVVGLATYLAVLGFACLTLVRGLGALKRSVSPSAVLAARAACTAAFAALWVHSLLYADFLEDPFAWALVAAAIALAARARSELSDPEQVAVPAARVQAPLRSRLRTAGGRRR